MQKQLLTIAIVGIVIIGAVTAGGYYLGKVIQKPSASPTPSDTLFATESASPSPSTASATPLPSLLPTAPARPVASVNQQVKGVTTIKNSTPLTATTGPADSKEVSIRFVGVPSQMQSGKTFIVSWFIDGPAGMMGDNTRLSSDFNSRNGSNSSMSQAFGAFQIPQKFQSNITFSGDSGPVVLRATASVNGKTYTATQTIQLTD